MLLKKHIVILNIIFMFIEIYGFSGSGKGTESNPYCVSTIRELQEIENDLNSFYILKNDIDASETKTWNNGSGFDPIGDGNNPFKGTIDGKGHVIKGLYIHRSTKEINEPLGIYTKDYDRGYYTDGEGCLKPSYSKEDLEKGYEYDGMLYKKRADVDNVGFIARNDGTVRSIRFIDAVISGGYLVGGISGENHKSILGCSYCGKIYGVALTGGITGDNHDRIEKCEADIAIDGESTIGGLVGRNSGIIVRSGVKGGITCVQSTGGLIGENSGSIAGCYSKTDITGKGNYLGGFVSSNSGLISGSYASGTISNDESTYVASGFAGQVSQYHDRQQSSIFSCFFSGSVKGCNDCVNSFAFGQPLLGIIENCYTAAVLIGRDEHSGTMQSYKRGFLLGTEGVKFQGNYENPSFEMVAHDLTEKEIYKIAGWDFETEWEIASDVNNGYPYHQDRTFTGKGKGTEKDPYRITTLFELQQINRDPTACYMLENDIDASKTRTPDWKSTGGFTPIMNFTGVLDGNGYRIFNLYINNPYLSHTGLIGFMKKGLVKNLGMVSAEVNCSEFTGLVVAENESGTIQNTYAAGKTPGGGLVGRNLGMVTQCFAFVDGISAGFVQVNRGSLVNNYFAGKLKDSIKTAFSPDGFWPSIENATVTGIFFDKEIAGTESDGDSCGFISIQMKNKKVYEKAGWNFSSIWEINENVNNGYPSLRKVKVPDVISKMKLFEGKGKKVFSGKGTGTRSDPYRITTLEQLQQMEYDCNSSYLLMNDIDASETKNWNYGKGLKPVGSKDTTFNGTFQGNGFYIKNLYVNASIERAGLFAVIGPDAYISNLKLLEVDIRGTSEVGALAGENRGRILGCSAQGRVSGELWNVGGLTGTNKGLIAGAEMNVFVSARKAAGAVAGFNDRGKIIQCSSEGMVSAGSKSGGIAGDNFNGVIRESFNRAAIKGGEYIGGITGWNRFSDINQTYSVGEINCSGNCGGITGRNQESTIQSSFYGTDSTVVTGEGSGIILTSGKMKNEAIFVKNYWDFETLWELNTERNSGFPFLGKIKSKMIELPGTIKTIGRGVIKNVDASSSLNGKGAYEPVKIFDGDYTTAWVEGAQGSGEGEWIEIEFATPQNIEKIIIVNGYAKSGDSYTVNNRICTMGLRAETETGLKERTLVLKDSSFIMNNKIYGETFYGYKGLRKIRFTIGLVYKGLKYDDTCISEIVFMGSYGYESRE